MRCRRRMSHRSWDSCRSRWSLTLWSRSTRPRLATGMGVTPPRSGETTLWENRANYMRIPPPRIGGGAAIEGFAFRWRSCRINSFCSLSNLSMVPFDMTPERDSGSVWPAENPAVPLPGRVVLPSAIETSAGAATGDEARALRILCADRSPRRSFRCSARLRPHPERPASRVAARRLTRPPRPYRHLGRPRARSRPPSPPPAIHSA